MKTEKNKLKLFSSILEQVEFDGNELFLPLLEYYPEHTNIVKNKYYVEVSEKIKNLLLLVNKDPSLLEKDVETELWYMV